MADDNVVASVKIQVLPDTSRFAKTLSKKVKAAIKEVEKKAPGLKIQAEFNGDKLAEEVKAAVKKAQEEAGSIHISVDLDRKHEIEAALERLKKELDAITRDPVEFDVELNEDSLREAIAALEDEKLRHIKAEIELDNANFADLRERAEKALADVRLDPKLDDQTKTKVRDDLVSMFERMDAIKVELEGDLSDRAIYKLESEFNALDLKVKANLDGISAAKVEAEADALARDRQIEFEAKLKTNAVSVLAKLTGFRLGFSMFEHFADFLNNIDKKVPIIGSMALAIAGLAGASIAAAGDIFSLSRALAQIGPGALALPGLIGGIGVGLLATAVVMKDFNKEFSNLAVGYGRNLKAGAAWQKLQNQMSDVFWKKVHAPMQALIQTVFPQIRTGLLGTSNALGTFFTNLSNSLNKELDNGALTRMFDSLNKSIRVFSSHTDSIASLIRIFGELGTRQLPVLADWFGKVLDKFNSFMKAAERTGDLDRWIATAVERVKELGRVVAALGKIFYGLAKAADASDGKVGNALDTLATGLESVAKWVNSSSIQKRLTSVFSSAHEMMSRIADKSGPAFTRYWDNTSKQLTKLLPRAGDAIGNFFDDLFTFLGDPMLQKGQLDLFDGIAKGLKALKPAMHDIAAKSGEMLQIVGDLAELFGNVFANKIQLLMPIMTAFLKVVDLIVKALLLVPDPIWSVVAAFIAMKKAQEVWIGLSGPMSGMFGSMRTGLTGMKSDLGIVASSWMTAGATTERQSARVQGAVDRLRPKFAALKDAARTAAGAGGLLLLTRGLSNTDGAISGLETALGAIATGFAVGGPWGGAIGAVVGGLKAVSQASRKSSDAVDATIGSWEDYASTLDGVTGSLTELSRQTVYQNLLDAKAFDLMQPAQGLMEGINVSRRTMVNGILGQKGAQEKLNAAAADYIKRLEMVRFQTEQVGGDTQYYDNIIARTKALVDENGVIKQSIKEKRKEIGVIKQIPDSVVTYFSQKGVPDSIKDIRKLLKNIDLTPKQVRTIMKLDGADFTTKQIRKVIATMKEATKTKGDAKNWRSGIDHDIDGATNDARRGGKEVSDNLVNPLRGTKANLTNFNASITSATTQAKNTARTGGQQVGAYLVDGVVSATRAGGGPLSAAAAGIIGQALDAMRRRAKIHSPSRETMAIGNYMGEGLVIGLGKQKGSLLATAQSLVGMLLKGLSIKESAAFKKRLNTITSLIPKSLSDEKRKELQKALAPEQKDLQKALGQWQSVVNKIKAKIHSIYQGADQLKQQVLSSVIALGDPTQLEVDANGQVTFQAITDNMTAAIDKAKAFAQVLKKLKKLGLNNDTFMQLVNAGPEAALASATAIADAGQSGVDALNDQQKELDKYAKQAAKVARKQYIDNGMAMAEGMLKGLRDRRKDLEKEMDNIAQSMVNTIKKALGIHSPSRVFRKLGNHTGTGFVLGVRDMQKKAESAMTKLVRFSPQPVGAFAGAESSYAPSSVSHRTVNYYAAPGQSLDSEEALFAALTRARSEGF